MDTPTDETTVICAECGNVIEGGRAYYRGTELKPYDPIFCSRECGAKYDPNILTLPKFKNLFQWLPKGEQGEIPKPGDLLYTE